MFFRKSHKTEPLDDLELISRYKKSEDSSFVGILFERYSLQIYGICRKYYEDEEARDAAMGVFEYLLKELLKYDIENFRGWLGRAVRNFCLMQKRKEKSLEKKAETYKNYELGLMEEGDFLHLNGEANPEIREKALAEALDELKDEQKRCVELFYLQDKSYEEVCAETGFTMNQVKSYIQNGKRNLKIRLEKLNEQE